MHVYYITPKGNVVYYLFDKSFIMQKTDNTEKKVQKKTTYRAFECFQTKPSCFRLGIHCQTKGLTFHVKHRCFFGADVKIPEMANPLNPTARTRKEMAMPRV